MDNGDAGPHVSSVTEITFRCPTYGKAELLRAWLKRRGLDARQVLEEVRVLSPDGIARAIAHQGGSRYGATLRGYDIDGEAS